MAEFRSPAITAGLLGAVAAASPNVALGATMTMGEATPFALVVPMAAGCLLGGVVGSAVSCMLTRRAYGSDVKIDFATQASDATGKMPAQRFATTQRPAPARNAAPVRNNPVVPRQAVPARPNQIRAQQQARANQVRERAAKSHEEIRRQGVAATLSERLGRSIPEFDFGTSATPAQSTPMPQQQATRPAPSPQATAASAAYAQQVYMQQRVFDGPPQHAIAPMSGQAPDQSQVMLMMGLTGSYEAMSSTGMMGQTMADRSQALRVPATPITSNPERAARIARSLAAIESGAYPEMRDASALGEPADGWARSLENMEEKIAETRREEWRQPGPIRPVITDVIGGVDTLDEPAGLEGDTSFIPFKVPAGHPDVVDTNSYVDYLIDDEFSQNSSDAVRDNAHKYLRVLQGGSQSMPRVKTAPARGGAHFRAMEA